MTRAAQDLKAFGRREHAINILPPGNKTPVRVNHWVNVVGVNFFRFKRFQAFLAFVNASLDAGFSEGFGSGGPLICTFAEQVDDEAFEACFCESVLKFYSPLRPPWRGLQCGLPVGAVRVSLIASASSSGDAVSSSPASRA